MRTNMLSYKYVGQKEDSKEIVKKITKEVLKEKSKEAEYFQEIRIGKEFLFYRKLLGTKYLYMDEIQSAFLRVESGESGDFPTQVVYLVLTLSKGKEIKFIMERYDTAKKMFAYMQEQFSHISYGFTK